MKKINFKRYIGIGYRMLFLNVETKEAVTDFCLKEEFDALATGFIPQKEGYTYLSGDGGFIQVDTSAGVLQEGEGTIIDNDCYVCELSIQPIPSITKLTQDEFNSKYIWQ